MANLSAPYWNSMVENVADRLVQTIDHLVEAIEASGYPPFTILPEPDVRFMLYGMRPPQEWLIIARTDPERALDEIRDWSNMARRRGTPEVVEQAARLVSVELGAQEARNGG